MLMRTNVVIAFHDVDHRGRCMEDMGDCEALGEATGLRVEPLCPSEQAQGDIELAFINASIGPLQTPPPLFFHLHVHILLLFPSTLLLLLLFNIHLNAHIPLTSYNSLSLSLYLCLFFSVSLALALALHTQTHTNCVILQLDPLALCFQ